MLNPDESVSSLVRKRVSDCVAELARRLIDEAEDQKDHPWTEIVNVLIQMAQDRIALFWRYLDF